jgi:hypothetical protein
MLEASFGLHASNTHKHPGFLSPIAYMVSLNTTSALAIAWIWLNIGYVYLWAGWPNVVGDRLACLPSKRWSTALIE